MFKNLIPHFIAENFKNDKEQGRFTAVVMFVDVVGFTAMTQDLIKHGKEGAEELSELINNVFNPAFNEIYNRSGWVANFAGDSFTAIFPREEADSALIAGYLIQDQFKKLTIKFRDLQFKLSLTMGMGYGTVVWSIVKVGNKHYYYFKGQGIESAVQSESKCRIGQIILTNKLLQKLKSGIVTSPKTKDLYLLKNLIIPPVESKSVKTKTIPKKILNKFIEKSILALGTHGEFREVVSVFISFNQIRDFKRFINDVHMKLIRFGGYLNKIDFGDKGNLILVLFGAPITQEKPVTRAMEFCLELHKHIGKRIDFGIGMSYGTVFAGFVGTPLRSEYTVLGENVNLAARLMSETKPGEILFESGIEKIVKFIIDYKKKTFKKLRGFKNKIPIYKAISIKSKVKREVFHTTSMVGRIKELKNLYSATDPLREETCGGIIYVHGNPGIGKSRFVYEAKHHLVRQGFNWCYMPTDDIVKDSFNPIKNYLRYYFKMNYDQPEEHNKKIFEENFARLLNQVKDSSLKEELIRTKHLIARLLKLNFKNSQWKNLSPEVRFKNTIFGLKAFFKAEATKTSLIIEIEDAHNLDDETIEFLKYFSINITEIPVLIIASCRFNNDGSKYQIPLNIIPSNEIILDTLDKSSAKVMIEERINGGISNKLFNLIWNKSEGNPFFIEQIVLYLLENDFINYQTTPYDIKKREIEIPKLISNIIIARVDMLESELKSLITTASILGKEFSIRVLSCMLEEKRIIENLKQIENEGIWNIVFELRGIFRHTLIRDAVYEMQLKKTRRNLHKLAAETIEDLNEGHLKEYYIDLAYHYEQSGKIKQTIYYLDKAGEYEHEQFHINNSITLTDRLLKYIQKEKGTESERLTLLNILKRRANLSHLLGDIKESVKYYKQALSHYYDMNHPDILATIYDKLAWEYGILNDFKTALMYADKGLKIVKDNNLKQKELDIIDTKGSIYHFMGDHKKALESFNYVLNTADPKSRVYYNVCNQKAVALLEISRFTEAKPYLKKIIPYYKKHSLMQYAYALINLALIYDSEYNFKSSKQLNKEALEILKEIGDKRGYGIVIGNIGHQYTIEGKFQDAIKCQQEKENIFKEIGNTRGVVFALHSLGKTYRLMHKYHDSERVLKKALDLVEKNKFTILEFRVKDALAELYVSSNRIREARKYLNETVQLAKLFEMRNIILRSDVLFALLDYKEGKAKKALSALKTMHQNSIYEFCRNEIAKNLWEITGEEKYRIEALKLYEALYKKKKYYYLKEMIEALK